MRLLCINLPAIAPVHLLDGKTYVLGRSTSCDIPVPDPRVSGRHALLMQRGGVLTITDLNSKHGIKVSGVKIGPGEGAQIASGDLITIGPVAFKLVSDEDSTVVRVTEDDHAASLASASIADAGGAVSAQQMLEAISTLAGASSERELCEKLAWAAVELGGFSRAAVIEPWSNDLNEVRVLASAARPGVNPEIKPSRSLVRHANQHGWAMLSGKNTPIPMSQSIMTLDIQQACCAALRVELASVAMIYADSRGKESAVGQAGHDMVRALAGVGSLSWSNMQRAVIETRRKLLERDLEGARRVQERFLPAREGTVGACNYALAYQPGRMVAGDMVDIFEIPSGGGKVGLLLGDVVDKGPAAALLMATLQTQARQALRTGQGVVEVMKALNREVCDRFEPATASLWLALWDPASRTLSACDAGHGYAAIVAPDGSPTKLDIEGGTWLGVETELGYDASELRIAEGTRLVVLSDGVCEQRGSETGQQFGMEGSLAVLGASVGAREDVSGLLASLRAFAGGNNFADDVTVLAVELA